MNYKKAGRLLAALALISCSSCNVPSYQNLEPERDGIYVNIGGKRYLVDDAAYIRPPTGSCSWNLNTLTSRDGPVPMTLVRAGMDETYAIEPGEKNIVIVGTGDFFKSSTRILFTAEKGLMSYIQCSNTGSVAVVNAPVNRTIMTILRGDACSPRFGFPCRK